MSSEVFDIFATCFSDLPDPRSDRSKRHLLFDILIMGICAVLCGADDYVAMAEFCRARESWFRQFLELPNGIPSHDTFWRVFEALDSQKFQACFLKWVQAIRSQCDQEIVAIDGKQLRRSFDKSEGKAAIQMVSAWATQNRLVLGQVKVDDKSNEITAIPELLECLELTGCLVTADAMACQTEIAQTIVDKGADYLLSLKANQEHLFEDVILLFDDLEASRFTAYPYEYAKTVDKGHGRIEIRHCWTISEPNCLRFLRGVERFPKLGTVVRIRRERYIQDQHQVETAYFIASGLLPAKKALQSARAYWQIENGLHWVLDIAFREDECRIRKGNGPQNFALLRHIALNLLKQETSAAIGIKNKRLRAAWDERYLRRLLRPLGLEI